MHRLRLIVIGLLFFAPSLQGQGVKFTALTLHEQQPPPPLPPYPNLYPAEIHMNAEFTLVERTGTYYIPFYDQLFKNSKVTAITNIKGTLRIACNGQKGCPGDHTYTLSNATSVKGDGAFLDYEDHAEYIPFLAKAPDSTASMMIMDNRDNLWLLVTEGNVFYEVPIILFHTR